MDFFFFSFGNVGSIYEEKKKLVELSFLWKKTYEQYSTVYK